MKKVMVLIGIVVWMLGCAAVGQASGTITCLYDDTEGYCTGECEIIGGKEYDVYRCPEGHTYSLLRAVQASSVNGRSDGEAGQAMMSSMKPDAEFGGQTEYLDEEYDFSKVNSVFVAPFSSEAQQDRDDEVVCATVGATFPLFLKMGLKEACPEEILYSADAMKMMHDKYAEYMAAGILLAEKDFYIWTLRNVADLVVLVEIRASGHDDEKEWSDVIMTVVDSKTGQTVFARRDQRIQPRVLSDKDSARKLTSDITSEYFMKLAELLRRPRQAQSE